jgi:hypothetical protein
MAYPAIRVVVSVLEVVPSRTSISSVPATVATAAISLSAFLAI